MSGIIRLTAAARLAPTVAERELLHDLGRSWPRDGLFYLCAFTMVAALVLGGGTRSGYLSDAILQFLSLPLLTMALWRFAELPRGKTLTWPLLFCVLLALVPLVQLVPLPPAIWTSLPNRQAEVEAFTLLGRSLPWMPISVAPSATWLSALSLIVPFAVFLGTALLDRDDRRRLSFVVLGIGLIGVFLGLSQVAQGPSSPLRFFDFSNPSEAVGFFANRNHFAALLYSLTLIAAAWAIDSALAAGAASPGRKFDASRVIALLASFTCLVVLIAGQAMARSRGGLALTIVALIGAFLLSLADRRSPSGITPAKLLIGSAGLAVMFATQFALYRFMERFTSDPLQDARITFARITAEAAKTYMPLGSGMGTFVPVYAQFEKPADVMSDTFANRAHNDLLEVWLESGAVGIVLMAIFAGWFVWRTITAWRPWPADLPEIDASLMRASTLIVGLLVAHSLVDYPIRTAAMMAIFAFACALLVEPPAQRDSQRDRSQAGWRHPERASPVRASSPSPSASKAPAREEIARWGEGIEWPEAWRKLPPRDKDR